MDKYPGSLLEPSRVGTVSSERYIHGFHRELKEFGEPTTHVQDIVKYHVARDHAADATRGLGEMSKQLLDYSVLTFDCYGTLIDWESGIWDALQPLLQSNGCDGVTRERALEDFAERESAQEAKTPGMLYPELLANVHADLARQFELRSTRALDREFGASVPHWPAFPDTADALRFLKKRFKLVILSNVNRDGFAASNRKLGVEFDAVYTAQDVGSYKPAPANFAYLIEHLRQDLGVSKSEILHTAQSLYHDHVPAKDAGLACAWIDRQGLSTGGNWGATARVEQRPDVDFLFPTMGEMAAALRIADLPG